MTLEVGRDCEFTDIIGQVFRVLDFDRTGTTISTDGKVKAKSLFKPYGYLLVESPILTQSPAKLPITHKDDFALAASVFDEPTLLKAIREQELLVTYVPKSKLPRGVHGIFHALHYVITPRGTIDRCYKVGLTMASKAYYDMNMTNPALEKIFCEFKWDGTVRVQVNPNPELKP